MRLVVPAERLSQSTLDLLQTDAWKIVLPVERFEELPNERSDIIQIVASPAPLELPRIPPG